MTPELGGKRLVAFLLRLIPTVHLRLLLAVSWLQNMGNLDEHWHSLVWVMLGHFS